ncbi:MAG TPA: AarF/ABC1/UbiB kinase family protein [Acidimicrobiales bacterium]|nr:AarF/ABC1/UbiB kinase family protein [Acidimicrobiales bacterium]
MHFVLVKLRAARATEDRRAELEQGYAIKSAEDVARVLGGMKGAVMKLGQLLSFVADGLPAQAQEALATLLADAPPMSPRLAAEVVRRELGADPERVFLDWSDVPVAAASIGQVHRAVTRDGRVVAVKVQYPGVDGAIRGDLDNAQMLYNFIAALRLKNLDVQAIVNELRTRMVEELDYTLEASNQAELAALYDGHPFVRIPGVVRELSTSRVLTSEWVEGKRWDNFLATSTDADRQRAAEIVYRFYQGSVHRYGLFNGDPHPGNYLFHDDGTVTFIDFGLVKRWSPGEWDRLAPLLDAVLADDPERTAAQLVEAGFLPPDHGVPVQRVWEYVSRPYVPLLTERFRYSQAWVRDALQTLVDVPGHYRDLVAKLDMPPSFVILDRVVWGVSGVLGRLEAEAGWRAIVEEYRNGAPPSTELGVQEAQWAAERPEQRLERVSPAR